MPNQIYRIYDTQEKRHRDDMFVNTKGLLYEVVNGYELKSVFQEDRYIVERSTGLYDKNEVLIYENDIVRCSMGCSHIIQFILEHGGNILGGMPTLYLSGMDVGYQWMGTEEMLGHKDKESHLLFNQQ